MVKTPPFNTQVGGGEVGLIPGGGARIPGALRPKHQNIKQKQHCNKLKTFFFFLRPFLVSVNRGIINSVGKVTQEPATHAPFVSHKAV